MITQKTTAVRHLARPAPILSDEDTLARACETLRTHNVGALAVAAHGRVIGLIREDDLLEPMSQDPDHSGKMRVRDFAIGDPVTIPATADPKQALSALQWADSPALPVVEVDGTYRGMLARPDLLAFWANELKPARIGGLATPFGVSLSGAGMRGGISDLQLIANGLVLGLAGQFLMIGWSQVLQYADRLTGWPILALINSPSTGMLTWMDGVNLLARLIPWLLFMTFIRFSPIAGYHAGEHQTVWAIERGEPLVPEVVAKMPRPHPRCGTNLVVGLLIFDLLRGIDPYLALIATVFLWRRIGHYAQLYLTTRPATVKQIESGIKAGKELLAKYRENPGESVTLSTTQRIWNLGLLQTLIGIGIASLIFMGLGISLGDLSF